MNHGCWVPGIARRQRGAALVEFAFVLPFLLALLVGTIYYGYVFMLQAAVTHAAREGAQVAVAVDPLIQGYEDAVKGEAIRAACASLDWLPSAPEMGVDEDCSAATADMVGGSDRIRVQVTLQVAPADGGGLLPQATLPLFGKVPPLPNGGELHGVAEVGL